MKLKELLSETVDVEFLFVDDGSRDRSLEVLTTLAEQQTFVKVVALSRNFGHQIAATAGIDHARGDWVALIDADLQDPPEAIAGMYALALEGFEVVYGKRRSRRGETAFKKLSAAAFYRLMSVLTEIEVPHDTGDFRVMSRRVVDVLCSMPEKHRFLRGMVPWIGYKSAPYPYDRDVRYAGASKYSLRKMLRFAANAIFSFSSKPLAIATKVGLLAAFLGAIGATYMLYLKLFTETPVLGVTSILVAIAFFGGVQIALIGLLGEYVARIFEATKARPLYIVSRTQNL
jgi:dolichol-phosphate mannosyltransferase